MCGVAGVWLREGSVWSRADSQVMQAAIAHRGPHGLNMRWAGRGSADWRLLNGELPEDAVGMPRLGLFHSRLATSSPGEAGVQPRPSPDGRLLLVWNGEIYNQRELAWELGVSGADGDSELLLAAWQRWGEGCFERLNGMWALALVDLRVRELHLCRDRYGIRSLDFMRRGDDFFFASDPGPLRPFAPTPLRVDAGAIYDFLTAAVVDLPGRTFYRSLHRLPPGHRLTLNLDSGRIRLERWYHPPLATRRVSPQTAAEELRERLRDSVLRRQQARLPVGVAVSGGLDSGTILRLARPEMLSAVYSSQPREPEANEEDCLRQVLTGIPLLCRRICPDGSGLRQDLDRLIRMQEEPFATPGVYAQWRLCRRAGRDGVRIMLDGQGADELLVGYQGLAGLWLHAQGRKSVFAGLRARLEDGLRGRQYWRESLPWPWNRFFPSRPGCALAPCLNADFVRQEAPISRLAAIRRRTVFGPEEELRNLLFHLSFADNLPGLLRYADRSGMASAVEGRFPFLDHRVVEYLVTLPLSLHLRGGWTKRVLRDATRTILPESIRWRKDKLGYATPDRRWLAGELRPRVEHALADPRLDPWLDRRAAGESFRQALARGGELTAAWRWLVLQRWLELMQLEA